jgi:hypothetical protein
MIFNRLKNAVLKGKESNTEQSQTRILTAEGFKRLRKKERLGKQTTPHQR